MPHLLVLDFDGTITDAETEGAPFRAGYLVDVATIVDRPLAEIEQMAVDIEAEIAREPDRHGWVFGGQIVAPATVDPYLRIMPVARQILDEFGCLQDMAERDRILDALLYPYNYQKTNIAFRPGARAALELLQDLPGGSTWVVTNSATEAVQRKIRILGADSGEGSDPAHGGPLEPLVQRVRGFAKKYVIDDAFTDVDAAMPVPDLDRPVLLRRRRYFDVLDETRQAAGVGWSDVTVVGDIFELDLALPLALGARVGLIMNDFTPAYEKAFIDGHERGTLLMSLDEIAALVG